jgi:uncharacterized membrane protein
MLRKELSTMPTSSRTINIRPILSLPRSTVEIALECAAIAGIFTFAYVHWSSYSSLPETVPLHFGLTGKADAWGSKKVLLFLFFLTCLLQFGLSWLSQYPHKFNYTVTITTSNAATQYRLARNMLAALKAILVWTFTYLAWQTIQTALGNAHGLGPAFLIIALALIFGTIGIYFVKASHAR